MDLPNLQIFYSYNGSEWAASVRGSDPDFLVKLAQDQSSTFARYDKVRDLNYDEDVAIFCRGCFVPTL